MEKMGFEEAKRLCSDPLSGFALMTAEEHIALAPRFLGHISEGIRQQMDAKIGFFCDKFDGALIAYSNIRLLGDKGLVIDDGPFIHFKVQADFVVFQPHVGSCLQGVVNKVGKDHIGLVVHDHFNVSIRLKSADSQVTVSKGEVCKFTVMRVYKHRNLLSLIGKTADI